MRGFSLNGLHDIASIKKKAAQWKKDVLSDDEVFKSFYAWTFDYLREDRKILSMEEAKTIWMMLDMRKRWKLWDRWMEFLVDTKKRQYISRDEWCVVLTFAEEHPSGVDAYDPEGPWPVLLDDFVLFVKGEQRDDNN